VVDYDVITYERPDGVIINLSEPPYTTYEYDGFGISEFQHTTVAPPQLHGEYWQDTRMEAKILTVEFGFTGEGIPERQFSRREVVRLFNPLLGPGTLRIDQVNGISREIRCILAESLPLPSAEFAGVGHYRTLVRFKSDGIPAFIDPVENEFVLDFVGAPGNFTFPWSFPRVFAQSGFATAPIVTNEGDIETPVRIELTGPLTNPILTNLTTDQSIAFTGLTLLAGQVFVVDTDPARYVVTIDGTDSWQYLSEMNMWSLIPGDNHLQFDIGGTTVATVGTVNWFTRYLGQ
jgi:hypothetical protein